MAVPFIKGDKIFYKRRRELPTPLPPTYYFCKVNDLNIAPMFTPLITKERYELFEDYFGKPVYELVEEEGIKNVTYE